MGYEAPRCSSSLPLPTRSREDARVADAVAAGPRDSVEGQELPG